MLITSSSFPLISSNSFALILTLLFLLSPSSCSRSSSGLMVEEKSRLGSTPPSCQNRCNMCHPCMAVQVPTTPSSRRLDRSSVGEELGHRPSPSDENRYSNYKPLGWKCRCQGHLYNP